MSPQPHPFRLHRAPLPLSLSLTAPAAELLAVATSPAVAAAGFGERWATTTGRAAVPPDLGEESEPFNARILVHVKVFPLNESEIDTKKDNL
ncbi:hypothetical protein OsJ_34003 [Oryza sativa Japonica Group]|uniref:Uncharacterized protein n=1 Tax=Oryza sativa subsp. japonica TaxID=39947 RepID=B9GAV0_ORYSJ|nr:hypothetical protein OsJ_34003 [Oryza sativa Japonica Group]